MSHVLDVVMTAEMLVGLISGAMLACFVGWLFPFTHITSVVQLIIVCVGLACGVIWSIASLFARTERRQNV